MTNTYFNNILISFINDSVATKKSKDTIKAYASDLHKFFEFLNRDFKGINNFCDIKRIHITSFLNYLRNERHDLESSIDRRLYCLRTFFKYLKDSDLIEKIPPILTQPHKKTKSICKEKTLTTEEIFQIANAFKNSKNPKEHYMFKALIFAYATTGARRSEIINLKWEDIDLLNRKISFEKLKNSTSDFIPMHDILFDALIEYKENCVDFCQGYLFTSNTGNRLSETSLRSRFEKAKAICSLDGFTCKTFRRSFCTTLAVHGASPHVIASITGHKDIKSLDYYIAINEDVKRIALNSYLTF